MALDTVFRDQWGRVLATLAGILGDIELAEDAAAEAFAPGARFEALIVALVPARRPARAAPVSRNLFDFVIFPNVLLNEFDCSLTSGRISARRPCDFLRAPGPLGNLRAFLSWPGPGLG